MVIQPNGKVAGEKMGNIKVIGIMDDMGIRSDVLTITYDVLTVRPGG